MRTAPARLAVPLLAMMLALAAVFSGAAAATTATSDVGWVEPIIPGGTWRGDMPVTVQAGPEITRFNVSLLPGGSGREAVTAVEPNANPDQPLVIKVPTWGLDAEYVMVRVVGCVAEEPCESGGLLHRRWVRQDPASAVTAQVTAPANPIWIPEESATITPHNPGGGRLFLIGTPGAQLLDDASNSIDLMHTASPLDLTLARCAAGYTHAPPYSGPPISFIDCEQFPLGRTLTTLRAGEMQITANWTNIVTDPTAAGRHSTPVSISSDVPTVIDATYELRQGDRVVAGPTTWATGRTVGAQQPLTMDYDPVRHAASALPDGDYQLRVTATARKGDLTRVASQDLPLALADAPPPQDLGHFSGNSPNPDVRGSDSADLEVEWSRNAGNLGRFTIRNSAGRVIATQEGSSDCRGDTCMTNPQDPSWFELRWDGRDKAGSMQPPGEYPVTFEVMDDWGRWIQPEGLELGSLYVNHLVTKTVSQRVTPADHTWSYNVYGKCSTAITPGPHGWPGSVAILSLWKCSDDTGKYDWVFRTFRPTYQDPDGQRLIATRFDFYAAPIRDGMVGRFMSGRQGSDGQIAFYGAGTLTGGLGWHNGVFMSPWKRTTDGNYWAFAQARVTGGNQWDLKFLRTTWKYRAWSR